MTDEVAPIGPVVSRDRREQDRRTAERRAAAKALVVAGPPAEAAERPAATPPAPASDGGAVAFTAQLLGQSGQRRGLRGGPPVLETARSTYLETRYSGAADRRPKPGVAEDTDV
jgi:hypothetical protein